MDAGSRFSAERAPRNPVLQGQTSTPLADAAPEPKGRETLDSLEVQAGSAIFGNVTVNFERLARRLRQITALSPGLEIRLREQRPGRAAKSLHYVYNNGLVELLNEGPPVGELVHESPLTIVAEKDGVSMELAMQYENSINCRVLSFVNLEITKWGSIEMAALLAGLADAINAPCQFEHEPFSADFVRHGLNCILSIKNAQSQILRRDKGETVEPQSLQPGSVNDLQNPEAAVRSESQVAVFNPAPPRRFGMG